MATKFLIRWNAGYGENYEVAKCETAEEAQRLAYEKCREEFENNADYSAALLTPELATDYDLETDADGE